MVPGGAAEFRRAPRRRGPRRRAGCDRLPLADARPGQFTFAEFREQVARARAGLARLGVGPGDRVVAYLPNIPETLVAFAATASLGAVWASCAPELGVRAVVDRLVQLEPSVLLAVGGYGYRDRSVDRRDELTTIRAALPSLRHVVHVPYGEHVVEDALSWDELLAEPGPLTFDPVAFDHPLFVLFSSGTTGKPKAIVHGHGGILLESLKAHAFTLGPEAGRSAALVQHDLVDDVERARVRVAPAVVDRDARRRSGVARPGLAVAGRGGDAPDVHGRQPGLPDGVPQGGPRARARVRPRLDPPLRHGRLAAAGRGVPLRLRPARARRAAGQRQRRHRRLQRHRRRFAAPAGLRGRDLRAPPRRRHRRVRPARPASRRRAWRARDHEADAVHARRTVGRRRRLPLPPLLLRHVPGRLAPGRLDQVLGARQLRRHGPLGRDAQPRRGAPRHGRVLQRHRGAARDHRQPRHPPRGCRGRRRRARAVRRARRRRRPRRRAARADRPASCARSSRRVTCPT